MMNTKQQTKVISESTSSEQPANSATLNAMSPEAQRIAIARACGYKKVRFVQKDVYCDDATEPGWVKGPKQCVHSGYGEVPDYLSDLNAMHEAEKVLTYPQQEKYWAILQDLTVKTLWTHRATAAQRAEAFLRTIGEWEESEQGSAERARQATTDTP